jgi:hypothetical protein
VVRRGDQARKAMVDGANDATRNALNAKLPVLLNKGVAFHHAGLSSAERNVRICFELRCPYPPPSPWSRRALHPP